MTIVNGRFAAVLITGGIAISLCGAQAKMPKTTTESVKGTPSVSTDQLHGAVVYVDGNDLVVRMSSGEIREFHVPPSRKFIVDGNELTVNQLKPGTELTATVTTTTTPVTDRTTTIGSGKVWWVSGNTVIVTLPNNENRMYKVDDSYRFNVGGKPASVHDLRKGMNISAQKIVEEPRAEIASDTVVTGTAPAAPAQRAAAEPPAPAPRTAAATPTPAPAAPAPAPAPAAPEPASPPTHLPETASHLPSIGIVGLYLIAGSLLLRKLRHSSN